MSSKLIGTGVALATPFNKDLSIDFDGLKDLIEYSISGGVDYIVALGTTGESPVFSWEEKKEVLSFIIKTNNDRIPVVFGHGGNNTSELIEKSIELASFNIEAILSVSPYYSRPSQEGIIRHYELLADASPKPIILYNVPARTGSNVSAESTITLSNHPNIIGMKEASGNMEQCQFIIDKKPSNFLLLSGDDRLTREMILKGANGVISVIANILPEPFVEMVNMSRKHEKKPSLDLDNRLKKAYSLLSQEGNPSSLKTGLAIKGICGDTVRPPLFEGSIGLKEEWGSYLSSL